MNIDEIQDIEVLKGKLKRYMVKCVKEVENENFKVGEYYFAEPSLGEVYLYDDNNEKICYISDEEYRDCFK
ncbi:TPA: hypothetical protein ACF2DD_002131 [Clostridium perfringens]